MRTIYWSEEMILDSMINDFRTFKRWPTAAKWRHATASTPCFMVVYDRFQSWRRAVELAKEKMNVDSISESTTERSGYTPVHQDVRSSEEYRRASLSDFRESERNEKRSRSEAEEGSWSDSEIQVAV